MLYCQCYNQLQKCWDTPTKKRPFLLQIALVTGLWDIIPTSLLPPPSSLPFKVVPPSVEYGLQLLATLIRGGGGIQAQDHGQAIYANVWYSVSSTFTIGCSKKLFIRAETHEGLFNRFNPIFSWGWIFNIITS